MPELLGTVLIRKVRTAKEGTEGRHDTLKRKAVKWLNPRLAHIKYKKELYLGGCTARERSRSAYRPDRVH
jgi:hypothetical protein